jgi:hypothetical protein
MRGRVAAVGILVALLVAACGPSGTRFTTVFPARDGDQDGTVDLQALPVTLIDQTGTVTGIQATEYDFEEWDGDLARGLAKPFLDRPEAIQVAWMGGACEDSVRLVLTSDGTGGVTLAIRADNGFGILGGGCPAIGIGRTIVIGFVSRVDASSVDVRTDLED